MVNMLFSRYQELRLLLTLGAVMLFSLYSIAKDRTQWARLRPGQWWEVVWETYDDRDWTENFRMKRSTFVHLLQSTALTL